MSSDLWKEQKRISMRGLNAYKRKEIRQTVANAEEREKLILEHVHLVKKIVNRIAMRLPPYVELEDLYGAGVVGLIDAVEKFDRGRGVPFGAYAEFRIRGAVFDELRAMNHVPRSARALSRRMEEVYSKLENALAREPEDEEMAEALGMDLEEYHKSLGELNSLLTISLNRLIGEQVGSSRKELVEALVDDTNRSPFERMEMEELKSILARAISQLPEKYRLVLSLYYFEEMNMKEVGLALNVTESRVSQIHAKCMLMLRKKMRAVLSETG